MQPPTGVVIHRLRAAGLDFFSGHLPSGRWFMPQDWITQGTAKVCPRMLKSLIRPIHETLKDQRHSHWQKENR